MATATKAAQSGTAATEAAVSQVSETVAANISKVTAAANDIVARTTDALAPVVKSAEAKTAELTEAFTAEVKKAEAKTKEWSETFAAEAKKAATQSVDSYQKAVQRYLDVTIEFVDTFNNDAVSDLTRRNAKAVTELVDASVGQAHELLNK